jgi:hypothetical protein
MLLVSSVCLSLVAAGCEGTDSRDRADDVVEEVVGKKNTDRYQRLKDDLGEIEKKETEKYRRLEEGTDEK